MLHGALPGPTGYLALQCRRNAEAHGKARGKRRVMAWKHQTRFRRTHRVAGCGVWKTTATPRLPSVVRGAAWMMYSRRSPLRSMHWCNRVCA